MKNLIHFIFLSLITTSVSLAQSVTNTYTVADIPTNLTTYSAACNGPVTPLTVSLPAGGPWEVTSVEVWYDMTALGGGWMSEQNSKLYCQNTTTGEATYATGTGTTGGTQSYNRAGLNIANGVYAGGTNLVFEMQAYRTWGAAGCGSTINKVDNNTWIVTVNYSLSVPMSFTSSTVTQTNTTDVLLGSTNQEIIGIEVQTSGSQSPFDLTQFQINMTGTTNTSDVTNIDIYYTGTNSTFATTTLYGSVAPGGGTLNVNGAQTLSDGTNYFWLVYDINGVATPNNTLDAQCTQITMNGGVGNKIPIPTSVAGFRTIRICPAGGGCGEYINRVRLSTIDNTSGGCGASGYSDFTGISTNLNTEAGYMLTVDVVGALGFFPFDSLSVWVDWNNDFDFDDANESITVFDNPSQGPFTAYVEVPSGTVLGNKTMRIRLVQGYDNYSNDPCGTSGNGEVEDYTIAVVNTGPPNVTVTIDEGTSATICRGDVQVCNTTANTTVGSIASYMWYSNNQTTGISTSSYSVSETGTFKVIVVNTLGEAAVSEDFNLTVNDLPLGGISGTTSTCENDLDATLTFNLVGSGPFDVVYEPGTTSLTGINDGSTIVVNPVVPTSFYLTQITDANGCVSNLGSATNLITNPSADNGLTGWTTISNGGNGWTTSGGADPAFRTSYDWDTREQVIDLIAEGYTAAYLDSEPVIYAMERYKGFMNCSDYYYLEVTLEDAMNTPIATYNTGNIQPADCDWHTAAYTFSNYGTGVRFIRFEDGGDDIEWWAGHYGTVIDDAAVFIGNLGNLVEADVTPVYVTEGDVTGGANVCYGSPGPSLTVSGQSGTIDMWQSSTDGGVTWTNIANTNTTYTAPELTQTTLFQAIVNNGGCTDESITENVTVNPYPVAISPDDGAVGVCYINSATSWVHIVDANDKFIASVRGVNLDNTNSEVILYEDGGGFPEPQYYLGDPYLNRVTYISPTVDGPADVTLYFTQQEFAALQAVDPTLASINELVVTKFDHGTFNNGVLLAPSAINANTPFAGVHSITVTVTGFSDFYIHKDNGFILPVSLSQFNGRCNGEFVTLNWSTASEKNNAFFILDKSNDAMNWSQLTTLNGAGNSNRINSYRYDDPSSGSKAYYRLSQKDEDGSITSLKIISIDCNDDASFELENYSTSENTLKLKVKSNMAEDYTVSLIDQFGRIILHLEETKDRGFDFAQINTGSLSKGVYLILVKNRNKIITKKWVKY